MKTGIEAIAFRNNGAWHVACDMDRRMDGPCGGCSMRNDEHALKLCSLCMRGLGRVTGRFRRARPEDASAMFAGMRVFKVNGLVVRMDGRPYIMRSRKRACLSCAVMQSDCGLMPKLCGRLPGLFGSLDRLSGKEAIAMALEAEGGGHE